MDGTTAQVTIDRISAEKVTADVLVLPATTSGGYGRPWNSIATRLGVRHEEASIPHGQILVVPVPGPSAPIRFLALAATVDPDRPTTGQIVHDIGASLGRLTGSSRDRIQEIATPLLGTGVGRLDPEVSLTELVSGFRSSAAIGARLRIVEVDESKVALIERSLPALLAVQVPAQSSSDVAPTWEDIGEAAQAVLAEADSYRVRTNSSQVHTEQLLVAAHRSASEGFRRQLEASSERLSGDGIIALAQSASKSKVPERASSVKALTKLPRLSGHAQFALSDADLSPSFSQDEVSERVMRGILSIPGCGLATALADAGLAEALSLIRTPTTMPIPGPSGDMVPDDAISFDRLGLGREVDMVASVLVAKVTPLPLAIGLFGDWGSGKSFFMAMLRQKVRQMSAEEHEDEPYRKHIRQIHFNAWHYAEENLWASLAATIFDGLVDKPDDEATRKKSGELGKATEVAAVARVKRVEAEDAYRSAQQAAEAPLRVVTASLGVVMNALRHEKNLEQQLKDLQIPGAAGVAQSTRQLVEAVDCATSLGDEVELFRRLAVVELVRRRAPFTLFATLVIIAAIFLTVRFDQVGPLGASITAILVGLTPVLVAASRVLRLAREARWKAQRPVDEARTALESALESERLADEAVVARQAELRRLGDRGDRLHDLVRSAQATYGEKLGLISQLRQDFEHLSWLLNQGESGGSAPDEPPPQELKDALIAVCTEGVTDPALKKTAFDVDRIVLYIDDLDRCPAKVVVKVLQAVNLLLAFKLFVVVIGVDGRWLTAALEDHYKQLLVSPVEYLEKIIQLPFVLNPMSAPGYEALVHDLVPQAPARPRGGNTPPGQSAQAAKRATTIPAAVSPPEVADDETVAPTVVDPAALPAQKEAVLRPELLVLEQEERELLAKVGVLIETPRSAKRLINSYRMLRVCAGRVDQNYFRPDGGKEYQAVVVLLTMLIGCPDRADRLFPIIRAASPDGDIWATIGIADDSHDPLSLLATSVDVTKVISYQRWLPLVSRFSYRRLSIVPEQPTSPDVITGGAPGHQKL